MMASAGLLGCSRLDQGSIFPLPRRPHVPPVARQHTPSQWPLARPKTQSTSPSRRLPLPSLGPLCGLRVTTPRTDVSGHDRRPRVGAQSRDSGQGGTEPAEGTAGTGAGEVAVAREHNWGELTLWLFLAGFFLGAPLDGLHSVVGLQVYDGPAAVTLGSPIDGLLTSLWVPPLLGAMYVVVGLLELWLHDTWRPQENSPAFRGSRKQMFINLAVLISLLRLSSLMYENNIPPLLILGTLCVLSHGSWYSFDRTLPGYGLALLVALGAPLSEVVCLKLGLWHYSTPDVYIFEEGLVSWTTCCYFFYTQWVASVARALDSVLSPVALPDPAAAPPRKE